MMSPEAKPWYACRCQCLDPITRRFTHHVEEDQVLFLLDDLTQLLPLILSRVNSCGILGTRVEQYLIATESANPQSPVSQRSRTIAPGSAA